MTKKKDCQHNRKTGTGTRLFAMLLTALLICAQSEPAMVSAASLSINNATLDVGEKLKLRVKKPTAKVKWSVSNSNVIRISTTSGSKNQTATIKACQAGSSVVTAKLGSKKLKAKISVFDGNTHDDNDDDKNGGSTAHTHIWSDATCQKPKTCTVCGATEGEMRKHVYDSSDHCMWCGELNLNKSLVLMLDHTAPFGDMNVRWIRLRVRNVGTSNFEILTSRPAKVYTPDTGTSGFTVHLTDSNDLEYNERRPFRVDISSGDSAAFFDTQSNSMLFTFTTDSTLEFFGRYGDKIYKFTVKSGVPTADGNGRATEYEFVPVSQTE